MLVPEHIKSMDTDEFVQYCQSIVRACEDFETRR